jgi:hypothetical protein
LTKGFLISRSSSQTTSPGGTITAGLAALADEIAGIAAINANENVRIRIFQTPNTS